MSRMSREEAKIFLFSIADDLGFTDIENYTCKDGKKMREAIEVLSPCDDAVSRDELLKAIDTWDKFGYTETGCFVREPKGDYVLYIHYDDVIKCIKGMPPVTQKSETVTEFADRCRECGKMSKGHWIYDETIENWRCSKCNETPKTMGYVGTADFMAEHFKFCNHCGCRMVEPQERQILTIIKLGEKTT